MEIKIYLRMLQRGWWLIAITGLVAFNVALIFSYISTPVYRASARFVVSPNPEMIKASDVLSSLQTLDRRSIVTTYVEFLISPRIFQETITLLGMSEDQAGEYKISSVALPNANILELSVEGPDAETAALLANRLGQRGTDYIKTYYQAYDISLLDPAEVSYDPVSPQPLRDSGLALVLGIVVGSVLAILSEQIRIPLDAYRHRRITDTASGAFNRRHMQNQLAEEITRTSEDHPLALALIELGGLKDLKDTLPQPVLQHVIKHVTDTLRNELRGSDRIGRWGDIQFALILPATSEDAAKRTLIRIGKAISSPIQLPNDNESLSLDPQMGATLYKLTEPTTHLIRRAEEALDQARVQAQPNKVVLI